MTGTAETEAGEFFDIYKLDVVVIPTNQPMVCEDHDDQVYKTRREKYNAVIAEIEEMRKIQRPILVGTTSESFQKRSPECLSVKVFHTMC